MIIKVSVQSFPVILAEASIPGVSTQPGCITEK